MKLHFKTFKTSPLSLSVVKRGYSGNFVILSFQITTSVLLYRSRFIIQSSRFFCIFRNLSKPIRPCKRYGLQIVRNGNISGVLVNSCIMRQSCKVSYTKLQLPQIVIAQPVANVKFFTPNCQYDSIHIDCNYKAYNSAVLTFYICIVWLKALRTGDVMLQTTNCADREDSADRDLLAPEFQLFHYARH